jgi:hypothetical protein
MNENNNQSVFPIIVTVLIIAGLIAAVAYDRHYRTHRHPKNPMEDIIQVTKPVLRVNGDGSYYISNETQYYRVKTEQEAEALKESLQKKREDLEKQVQQQQNLNINHNIHITVEDDTW